MPQFDIASFFPQVSFFTCIFIILYTFLTKNALPKISQNLKLNKRLLEVYNNFGAKEFKDLNLLSYIYNPSQILSYLIYKEAICLIHLNVFYRTLRKSYISSIKWLVETNKSTNQIRLLEFNRTYLKILQDIYSCAEKKK